MLVLLKTCALFSKLPPRYSQFRHPIRNFRYFFSCVSERNECFGKNVSRRKVVSTQADGRKEEEGRWEMGSKQMGQGEQAVASGEKEQMKKTGRSGGR